MGNELLRFSGDLHRSIAFHPQQMGLTGLLVLNWPLAKLLNWALTTQHSRSENTFVPLCMGPVNGLANGSPSKSLDGSPPWRQVCYTWNFSQECGAAARNADIGCVLEIPAQDNSEGPHVLSSYPLC